MVNHATFNIDFWYIICRIPPIIDALRDRVLALQVWPIVYGCSWHAFINVSVKTEEYFKQFFEYQLHNSWNRYLCYCIMECIPVPHFQIKQCILLSLFIRFTVFGSTDEGNDYFYFLIQFTTFRKIEFESIIQTIVQDNQDISEGTQEGTRQGRPYQMQ